MKRMLLKWSAAALAVTAMVLPVHADGTFQRVNPKGGTPKALNSINSTKIENTKKMLNLRKATQQARLGSQGLGPGGQMELTVKPAINYLNTRSAETPRGTVYALIPSHRQGPSSSDAMLATLDLSNGQVKKVYSGDEYYLANDDYFYLTTCTVDGIIYIPAYTQDMVTGDIRSFWRRIDLATGQQLGSIDFGEDITGFCYALAYNPKTQKFYGLGMNLMTGTGSEFYEFDLTGSTPKKQYFGNIGFTRTAADQGYAASLVLNPEDGELYTIKDNGSMYIVPQEYDPQILKVKEFSRNISEGEYFAIPDEDLPASLTYSPRDRAFVTIYADAASESMKIVLIDVDDDYSVYLGSTTSLTGWYSALECLEPYAENDAPAQATLTEIKKEKADLSGTIEYVAPVEVYDGTLIEKQQMTIRTYVDDEEIDARVVTPGQEVSVAYTTTQGSHKFSITPEFADGDKALVGPTSSTTRWIGNDNPEAPTGLALDHNKLTWKPVGSLGSHAGYVDTEAVTYDVYFDGKKQNAQPLAVCEYTFDTPADLARRSITVTANANGLSSKASDALSEVFGQALGLPAHFTPTPADAALFTSHAPKNSPYDFQYYAEKDGTPANMGLCISQYTDTPDHWLFMPKMTFPSAEYLYQVAVMYANYYSTETTKIHSMLKICIGKEPTPEAMTTVIYERAPAVVVEPLNVEALFSVPEPGDYYIGFYTGYAAYNNSRGIRLWDFNVQGLENVSSKSPAGVENVVATPAPNGELAGNFEFNLPSKAIDGTDLDVAATGDITVEGSCGEHKASVTGKAGEKVSLKVAADADGYSFFDLVTIYNGTRTIKRTYRIYTGIDTPIAPQNIHGEASADNLSLYLTWDPVTTGVNGGWINPATVKYPIYTHSGITSTKVGETRETHYTFVPSSKKQEAYYVGPVAETEKGTSTNSVFAYEFLGTPYEMPMIEKFTQQGTASFAVGPWKYDANGNAANFPWNHTTDLDGLGLGNPAIDGGVFYCMALEGGSGVGTLYAPKVSTVNIHEARIGIRYWNYENAADFEVWGRRYGHSEAEKLFTVTPSRPANPSDFTWVDWQEVLPEEYQNCSWIQLDVKAHITSNQYSRCILDKYQVYQDVDHDFRISGITGPASVWAGETPTFYATINNSGLEAGRTYVVARLFGDDTQLRRLDLNMRRMSPATSVNWPIELEMNPDYLQYKELKLVVSIEDEEDEVAINNTKEYTFALADNQLPIVKEVSAEWADSHDKATISWTEPSLEFGDKESFEFEEPFANSDKIGQWTNVDMDGMVPFGIPNATWKGYDDPCGWIPFRPATFNLDTDDRMAAHSGDMYLIARSPSYDESTEQPTQAADWLISPEIVGGSKVSFWLGTPDAQYTETVEIWYSTTDTTLGDEIVQNGSDWTCGSWKRIRPFSKSGADTWEFCEATLPADAKYFALVYHSWGMWAAMIDDVEYTPAQLPKWEIVGYDVYREGKSGDIEGKYDNVAWHTPLTSITDEELGDNNATYFVHAVVRRADGRQFTSPRSNGVNLYASSVDDLKALSGIQGGRGELIASGLEGETLAIYTADGKYLRQVRIDSNRESIGIDAGIYVVKSGNRIAKVIVK